MNAKDQVLGVVTKTTTTITTTASKISTTITKTATTVTVVFDKEKKAKAMFVLKTQGKTLSQAVREMTDKLAEEFDKKNSK